MKKIVSGIFISLALSTASFSASTYLAKVNNENITLDDVAMILRNPNIKFDTLPKQNKEQIINQLIDKTLLSQQAIKSKIQNNQAYKDALKKLKKDLGLEIWMQKEFSKINVSKKEKEKYYANNSIKYKTDAVLEARHILLKTKKEAQDIIKELNKAKNKKETFIKLAKEKSVGPSAKKGGYLGKFKEKDMVEEFSKATISLNNGMYTKQAVKTQFGYHIIYLEDKKEFPNKSFKKVENSIEQNLKQTKFRNKLKLITKKLRKTAKIIIK